MYIYFQKFGNTKHILEWKSRGLSDESIKPPTKSNNTLNPLLNFLGTKIRLEFNESSLKHGNIKFIDKIIVNIYIVYKKGKNFNISSYPTLENVLFGAVSLIKHIGIDEYKYSEYGIGFDKRGTISIGNGFGRNCIISGVDISSSAHVDNEKKDVLILLEVSAEGLDGTTLKVLNQLY